jgi:hypothetical protein
MDGPGASRDWAWLRKDVPCLVQYLESYGFWEYVMCGSSQTFELINLWWTRLCCIWPTPVRLSTIRGSRLTVVLILRHTVAYASTVTVVAASNVRRFLPSVMLLDTVVSANFATCSLRHNHNLSRRIVSRLSTALYPFVCSL